MKFLRTVFVSVFHSLFVAFIIYSILYRILYCIFTLCIIVTNLASWLQDLNKLTLNFLKHTKQSKKSTLLIFLRDVIFSG